MAEFKETTSFSDFPEDVQLCILSFLTPPEISAFACTCKRSLSLCLTDSKLWFSLCHRRFDSRTPIHKWVRTGVSYRRLYWTLTHFESLLGFWRRCGQIRAIFMLLNGLDMVGADSASRYRWGYNFLHNLLSSQVKASSQPPLVVFEWGPSYITGSRVSPARPGSYEVTKSPFLWLSITPTGAPVSFLDPNCEFEFPDDVELEFVESGLVPVSVSFMGKRHVVVEECPSLVCTNGGNKVGSKEGGLVMSEVYQYFANRTSPGGDRAARRRQWRKEKERRKLEPEHFVKIDNCCPNPARPLQGLWKGIDDRMNLDFYLVEYDDIGGIVCRRVGEWSQPFSCYSPVFWTPNTSFTEPPFSRSEQYTYESRIHLRPIMGSGSKTCRDYQEVVSRVLDINSSYDLVIMDPAEVSTSPHHVEGRIWQYDDGTFGFGFLRDNYIIDLKPIALDGCLLDVMVNCND